MLEKAQQALDAEMNMVDIVMMVRYFKLALQHLLTPSARAELLKLSKEKVLIEVSSEDDSDKENQIHATLSLKDAPPLPLMQAPSQQTNRDLSF